MTSPDPLPPLRDAIADLDRALLELLRRRMEIAGEVG
ncbi:MAG: chorismate mutase, partial [Acidobacteria bacterium]|nr:chorismate mutase [Acidobacteriota bacterium]